MYRKLRVGPEAAARLARPGRPSLAPLPRALLAAGLSLHAGAALLFGLVDVPAGLYAESPGAFWVFLSLSAVLSVFLALFVRPWAFRCAAAAWLFLFLMLGYQFGPHPGERSLLLCAFLAILAFKERFPANLLWGALSSAAVWTVFLLSSLSSPSSAAEAWSEALRLFFVFLCLSSALCAAALWRSAAAAAAREGAELREVMRKLAEAQLGYLEFARSAEERSSTAERNRLSAELHDTIGYAFTNLEMILEAGRDLLETDRAKLADLLETGLGQVRQGMTETRRALYLVREMRDVPPFLNAVQRLADVFGKTTGMKVRVEFGNFPASCAEEIQSAFYHFIQEGLVNAFSHGKATQVAVSLSADADNLVVVLLDNGVGAEAVYEGIGIRGMRERFGKLGGTLSLDAPPDGFRISASVPANG